MVGDNILSSTLSSTSFQYNYNGTLNINYINVDEYNLLTILIALLVFMYTNSLRI